MGKVIMRVSNSILIILAALLFHSCYTVGHQTIKEWNSCYSNSKTGIDTLININGYYEIDYIYEDEQTGKKSTRTEAIVFSGDGIYIGAPTIDFFLNAVKKKIWDSKSFNMGIYNISNDTIWVKYIYIGSAYSGCVTLGYHILDSNTLNMIFYGNCDNPPKPFINTFITSNAKFISFKNLPNPDNMWIKGKAWFWCDKAEFKRWKKYHK
jgi:hypothetical protein